MILNGYDMVYYNMVVTRFIRCAVCYLYVVNTAYSSYSGTSGSGES
jgi:hypothetical protein